MRVLFLLFTIVPLVDLWLLVRIGGRLGLAPTIALVVLTGLAGAWLARSEGARVLRSWRAALAAGRAPDEGVLSGVMVLVGGALLVAPGLLTDVAGLALLFPPTRRLAVAFARRRLERSIERGTVRVVTVGGPPPRARRPQGAGGSHDVIDVTPRKDRPLDA